MFDNRFGIFIHWGIYAVSGVQEQVFARMNWPREKYEALMHSFNPVKYDPEQWVLLAKEAGAKYICFTAKHHDGFCMWNTKYTDYSIMNTPYGRDVLKMLSDACGKHGMALSIYYSNPDWHHPYGYNPASSHQWKAMRNGVIDTARYREYVKNQVEELLTNYGPIYTFYWDIPPGIHDPSLNERIRSLQPDILINNRGWSEGDFSTPEREDSITDETEYKTMTEACESVGEQSWGYRKNEDFHSIRYLTGSIDRVMAKGGSYILNVGPDAEGVIPGEYADRIRRVGDWYRRMEGCLERHEADPFHYGIAGIKINPCIARKKDGKTYFHFYNGIKSSAVCMSRFPSLPKKVRLMNTGEDLPFAIEPMPAYFAGGVGIAQEYLHIRGIPVDSLASEPIVIEVTW